MLVRLIYNNYMQTIGKGWYSDTNIKGAIIDTNKSAKFTDTVLRLVTKCVNKT